jgi:hypothetical protein
LPRQNVAENLPDPDADWNAFETVFLARLANQVNVLNLVTMKYSPWINIEELRKCYNKAGNVPSTPNTSGSFLVYVLIALLGILLTQILTTSS